MNQKLGGWWKKHDHNETGWKHIACTSFVQTLAKPYMPEVYFFPVSLHDTFTAIYRRQFAVVPTASKREWNGPNVELGNNSRFALTFVFYSNLRWAKCNTLYKVPYFFHLAPPSKKCPLPSFFIVLHFFKTDLARNIE